MSTDTTTRAQSERRLGWMLCAPAVLAMLVVTAYPILYALWLSFQKYDLRFPDDREWVWFDNYASVLSDPVWWQSVVNTVVITGISVIIELVLGFALAFVMHKALFGRSVVRASILVPYGIITVVAALAWRFAFDPTTGFVNEILNLDTGWFTQQWSAMFVIIITEVWKTTPFMALLLLAGLSQVSEDMVEAAKVDGATWWQRLWKVILPNMRAAIMVAVLFRALDAFRIFDNIFVMTRGAQDTESVSFLTYRQVIEQFELGIGSALSILLFLSVLLIAFLLVKLFRVDLAAARREG